MDKHMALPHGFRIEQGTPQVSDYLRLREVTGLSPFSGSAAEAGLKGTYYGVTVIFNDTVVGMGRIVGDGGLFFQIVDIAVDPKHQRRGLGVSIMSKLMDYLQTHAPESAYLSLLADVPANKLYEKFGFKETAPKSVAMARRV
jgi:ribosomal protein S18 acetylase RimI-like enzyme